MEQFSVKEKFGNEINQVWDYKVFDDIAVRERGYAVQDNILINSLLFIGINPSFGGEVGNFFYDNDQQGKVHKYFRKFQDISAKVELPWSHFDLLFVKETQQSKIEEICSEKNGIDFIVRQLEISKRVIELAQPIMIVVNNTLARKFLGFNKDKAKNQDIWLDYDFEFDNNIGTYIIKSGPLENVPVFFTSMLTGQRALDNGSYERLIWHINFAIEKLSVKYKL